MRGRLASSIEPFPLDTKSRKKPITRLESARSGPFWAIPRRFEGSAFQLRGLAASIVQQGLGIVQRGLHVLLGIGKRPGADVPGACAHRGAALLDRAGGLLGGAQEFLVCLSGLIEACSAIDRIALEFRNVRCRSWSRSWCLRAIFNAASRLQIAARSPLDTKCEPTRRHDAALPSSF